MARIRYLKPEFFKDEDLAELPHQIRLFFAGLWNYADKAGRLEDRPKRLKVEIFPYEKADIEEMLQILAKPKTTSKKPFIIRYQVDGNNYIQILAWHKHQKPHHTEKESEIPPTPPYLKGNGDGECQESLAPLSNSETTDKKPLKTKHLDFVLLTDKEHKTLCDLFGESQAKSLIEKLNNYIGSKGKKYKSHYFTILNWARKDGIQRQRKFEIPKHIKDFKEPDAKQIEEVSKLVKSTTEKMGKN